MPSPSLKEFNERANQIVYDTVKAGMEKLKSDWELWQEVELNEIENKARDGFIPWTNGGWESQNFTDCGMLEGSGTTGNLPEKAQKAIEGACEYNHKLAQEEIFEEYKEELEKVGLTEDTIDYHSLYEKGFGTIAERLSEKEGDFLSEDGVMFYISAIFYHSSNSRNSTGKSEIYLFCGVNWESPYFRRTEDVKRDCGRDISPVEEESPGENIIIDLDNLDKFEINMKQAMNRQLEKFITNVVSGV